VPADLGAEDLQRAADHVHGPIGVVARAAPIHLAQPPPQPGLMERAASGERFQFARDRIKPENARTALSR